MIEDALHSFPMWIHQMILIPPSMANIILILPESIMKWIEFGVKFGVTQTLFPKCTWISCIIPIERDFFPFSVEQLDVIVKKTDFHVSAVLKYQRTGRISDSVLISLTIIIQVKQMLKLRA